MVDLPTKITAEKENVETAFDNLRETMGREDKTIVELAALGTFLHNIYNGIENILKQILKTEGISFSQTGTWHKDLLSSAVSNKIISDKLANKLYEYLTFRHFFVHAYGFMLEEGHLSGLASSIPEIWSNFLSEIERYN